MTNASLLSLLRRCVAARHPGVPVEECDKVAILEDVERLSGSIAVFELGRAIRELREHVVLRAVTAARAPRTVLERWMLLERFGHTRNRTQFVASAADGGNAVRLRHVALDGGAIARVNDLYVWGLLFGLLECACVEGLVLSFDASEAGTPFFPGTTTRAPTPERTHTVTFRWSAPSVSPEAPSAAQPSSEQSPTLEARLRTLFEQDLLVTWTAERAARQLGMSKRTLQRALQSSGNTFRLVLHAARLASAHRLLSESQLGLSEIAFCAGFADHAHLTRSFRKHFEVPPSALREVRSKS